jgi:mevalonate kinase
LNEQYFYGHGKLLLAGEYFVLDGANSIALPTLLGQQMHVKYRFSNSPKLFWKSYDENKQCWFETIFELWHFDCLDDNVDEEQVLVLQKILRQARLQNIHFLRDELDVYVETKLEFSLSWGLGSSSTLIYNIAQWAYISPFELQSKTFPGSGYDIACAQAMGPIFYQKKSKSVRWEPIDFSPSFKDQLYFVYLNRKQNSRHAIQNYKKIESENKAEIIDELNLITDKLNSCVNLEEFEDNLFEHENIISKYLGEHRVYDKYFSDYWGAVKSLGAWGGDFVLVTSNRSKMETENYFKERGFQTIFNFSEIILESFLNQENIVNQLEQQENVNITH